MTKDQEHEFHRYFSYKKAYQRWLKRAEIMGFGTVRAMLLGLYLEQKRTSDNIAMLIGCDQMTVLNMMKRFNIKRRPAAHKR